MEEWMQEYLKGYRKTMARIDESAKQMQRLTDQEQCLLIAALAFYQLRSLDYLDEDLRDVMRGLFPKIVGVDRVVFTAERKFDGPPDPHGDGADAG